MDEDQKDFLSYWFSGFINGLEKVDDQAQIAILRECGKACASSYTQKVFQQTWEQSSGLQEFLELLALKFPRAHYRLAGEKTISVIYKNCTCDLVKLGWVKNPILCACSANNLQQNFASSLGVPVDVEIIASILGGDSQCEFIVNLGERDE